MNRVHDGASATRPAGEHSDSNRRRLAGAGLILLLILALDGCYYVQAVNGHMELMRKRTPIDEILTNPQTDDELKSRLELVLEARDFAVTELSLPDNDSYRSYSDLERPYVVWNVFAAPEFSLEAKTWCFPVAGCVAYKGFFDREKAAAYATRLKGQGFDVSVGGVSAYSTLGRFDDPVLNTMMSWSDDDLVETLFHELAHQKLYIKGDSEFNEAFATAVGEIGLQRWRAYRGSPDVADHAAQSNELAVRLRTILSRYWGRLETLYESDKAVDEKRYLKAELLAELSAEAGNLVAASGLDVNNILAPPLNNARLVSIGLYQGNVMSFRGLLDHCDQELECFYSEAQRLAEMEPEERRDSLSRWELNEP